MAQVIKNLTANVGDIRDSGLIPGLGRSPGEENGNPLQYSCLESPMDRGVWQAIVHGVAKSWTQLKRPCAARHACMVGPLHLADRSVPAQWVVGPSLWPTAPSLHSVWWVPPSDRPLHLCTVGSGPLRLADRSVSAQRVVGPSVWPTAPSLHSA